MTQSMKKLLPLLPLIAFPIHAADYSKCADFLNVEPPAGERRGYAVRFKGPFLPYRVHYLPFRLEADGEVVPNPHGVDGVRHTTRNEGEATVDVLEYPLPSLADLQRQPGQSAGDVLAEIVSKPDRPRRAVVTITRRPGTMEVVEDLNLAPEERNEAPAPPRLSVGESELEDFVPTGTRTVFDIEAGECVPRERTEMLVHREDPARRTEIVGFHLPFCRAIKGFIDREPGIQGVFANDVNSAMLEVFESHRRASGLEPREAFEELVTGPLGSHNAGELVAWRIAYTGIISLEVLHRAASVSHRGKENTGQRRLSGFSPVVAGHMVLALCYAHGLWDFLQEPDSAETGDGTPPVADPQ